MWLPGPPVHLIARSQPHSQAQFRGHALTHAQAGTAHHVAGSLPANGSRENLPTTLPTVAIDSLGGGGSKRWDVQGDIAALQEEQLLLGQDFPDTLAPLTDHLEVPFGIWCQKWAIGEG